MTEAFATKRVRLALTACLASTAVVAAAEAPKWGLAWEDDFNSLDDAVWRRVLSTEPTNNSLQAYLPQQVTVDSGSLVITATDEPFGQLAYRSGQVISRSEQRFGRWEVRAKMPTGRGMWPAIWLLPDVTKHVWPSGGEIDILENRGNEPHVTSSAFHYGTNPPFQHDFVYTEQQTLVDGQLANYHDSFHTYAVDWTDRYLRFYVDGVHHHTVYDEDVGNFLSQNTQPMQLVINNAIGGNFLPNPDGSTVWPQKMEVDWVRVYELRDGPGEAEFTNGGFEGTLSGWSLFGADTRRIQNVQASDQASLQGNGALKLFGAFDEGDRFSGLAQGITVSEGDLVTAAASAFVRSQDSIAATGNRLLMKIEFYDTFGSRYGDGMLGEFETLVADRSVVNDIWSAHQLEAVAPAGAVEARLAFVFDQPANEAGAVFIDSVTFTSTAPAAAGDFNADGLVDAADYTVWRDAFGQSGVGLPADANADGRVDIADYARWVEAYRSGSLPAKVLAVPEPGAALTATLAVWLSTTQLRTVGSP